MKKILSLVLVLALAMGVTLALAEEEAAEVELMSHEEYALAEIEAPVYVETYVQATQSWWDGKITVYAQSEDGAYFIYNMACSEEDAAKLIPGKVRIFNVIQKRIPNSQLISIAPGTTIVFVFDTDKTETDKMFDYTKPNPIRLFNSYIARQNLSPSFPVVTSGSPSRIRILRRISLGITTRPRSSMRRTIPVAFIS